MNNTMRTTCRLLSLWLLSALFFQSCATFPPPQPVNYPAPVPEVEKHPTPGIEPTRQVPRRSTVIAAEFSRQAEEQIRQGRPDMAAEVLERGLRAAPKEAMLWSQLAEVKLQQQHYQQARSLAAKSNSLAGTDTTIVRKNHWIIEQAQRRAASP